MPLPDLSNIQLFASSEPEPVIEVMVVNPWGDLREGTVSLRYKPNGQTCDVTFRPPLVLGWPRMGQTSEQETFFVIGFDGQRNVWGQGDSFPVSDWKLTAASIERIKKAWDAWVPKENP